MSDLKAALAVFDRNAQAYDNFRPLCPAPIVAQLQQWAQLHPTDRILEIGCGTGQLTLAIAKWKIPIIALEKGPQLAALAKKNCAAYSQIRVVTGDFEEWHSPNPFQLITACQSFHWLNQQKGLAKVHELLSPNGKVALIWHLDVSQNTPFWQATNPIYQAFFPSLSRKHAPSSQADLHETALHKSELFQAVERISHPWEIDYKKSEYLGLLSTFSTQSQLSATRRAQFVANIGQVIDKLGGLVSRKQQTVMLLAQKKNT